MKMGSEIGIDGNKEFRYWDWGDELQAVYAVLCRRFWGFSKELLKKILDFKSRPAVWVSFQMFLKIRCGKIYQLSQIPRRYSVVKKCKVYMKNFGEFFNNQIQFANK